jgi:hypothetical protein
MKMITMHPYRISYHAVVIETVETAKKHKQCFLRRGFFEYFPCLL